MPSAVRVGMSGSALAAAALGVLLLFAPQEVAAGLASSGNGLLGSLLGAALLGFAAMNWTAKGSTLGGIYGRAVLVANQTHLTIGALVLCNRLLGGGPATAGVWGLTAVYAAGAVFFIYLTFFSSGIRER